MDYVGLALIAIGFGALQIMLDRGEDYDWFASPAIRLAGLVAAAGIIGAMCWLLLTEKPVVDLRALADRNFAVASVMCFGIGLSLYSSHGDDSAAGAGLAGLHRAADRAARCRPVRR